MGRPPKAVKMLQALPNGIVIGEKPEHIELESRMGRKWVPVVENLLALPATKTIQINVSNAINAKNRIAGIRAGLKKTMSEMHINRKLQSALDREGIFHLWLR